MSNRFSFTYKSLAVAVFGVALLVIGGVVSFLATPAQGGVANPRVFTPLAIVLMLLGVILIASKGD